MKIGIFTDFHWGINKNSTEKLNVGIKVMREFGQAMEAEGVKEVIFMGDWNHSRDFIHVNTQERAREELITFASRFRAVHMIIGNHDCHYKDTNDTNSVEQFSQIENVHVYKDFEELRIADRKFAICPWGTLPNTVGKFDAAFGHFEFSGAALVGAVSNGPYTMDAITNITPLVFSGHFHIRKKYDTTKGVVITAGCPYEQNWGDVGNTKGFYTINTNDLSYEFHENKFSPRHILTRWSKIKEFDTARIKNNYVRIIVDSDYEYDDVIKVMQAFHREGARTVEPDYQFQKELSIIQETLGDAEIMSYEEAINRYIDEMDIDDDEKDNIRPIAIQMFKEASE